MFERLWCVFCFHFFLRKCIWLRATGDFNDRNNLIILIFSFLSFRLSVFPSSPCTPEPTAPIYKPWRCSPQSCVRLSRLSAGNCTHSVIEKSLALAYFCSTHNRLLTACQTSLSRIYTRSSTTPCSLLCVCMKRYC